MPALTPGQAHDSGFSFVQRYSFSQLYLLHLIFHVILYHIIIKEPFQSVPRPVVRRFCSSCSIQAFFLIALLTILPLHFIISFAEAVCTHFRKRFRNDPACGSDRATLSVFTLRSIQLPGEKPFCLLHQNTYSLFGKTVI